MQKRKRINKINKKHTVEFENNSFLPELYGNHDQNLAKFENYYGVSISYRGNILEISGDDESSSARAKFHCSPGPHACDDQTSASRPRPSCPGTAC